MFQTPTQLARVQRRATSRDKLAAFRIGSYVPASHEERASLLEWCSIRQLHGISNRFYIEAFTADPGLAGDLEAGHRYNAARSTALAAAGKSNDVATLNAMEHGRLRKQAVDWLRAI